MATTPGYLGKSDVEEALNLFERLKEWTDYKDEYLLAMLSNQAMTGARLQQQASSIDTLATLIEQNNDLLDQLIQNLDGDGTGDGVGGIDITHPPDTIDVEAVVDADTTNQRFIGVDPIRHKRVSLTLSALANGDEQTIAEVSAKRDEIKFFIAGRGVTAHTADVSGDIDDEESVVRYHYDYRPSASDGTYERIEGLSSVAPIGDVYDPEPFPRPLGPCHGFRVRFENRTDESGFTNTSIEAEDLGARLVGWAIEDVETA